MTIKSPTEKLEEFLAAQPSWLRKLLQLDYSLSLEEQSAWIKSDWWQNGGLVEDEYLNLLRRCSARWREHRDRLRKLALSIVPSRRPGRPRRDSLAEEAKQLRQAGKSSSEIAVLLRDKYTVASKKGSRQPTKDSIRKLLASREQGRTPDKPKQ